MSENYKNYPDKGLGLQYRELRDTPSLLKTVLDHFKNTNHNDLTIEESKDFKELMKRRFDVV